MTAREAGQGRTAQRKEAAHSAFEWGSLPAVGWGLA